MIETDYIRWIAFIAAFLLIMVVLAWLTIQLVDTRWVTVPLSLLVSFILTFAVTLRCRARMIGKIPSGGSVLVVSNHIHDFDGAFVPTRLLLRGHWRHPIYSVASQRLFEPGFLAIRGPRWLGVYLRGFNAGPILRQIGIRPIEDLPRTRPLTSWLVEIHRQYGNLPLDQVVESAIWQALQHGERQRPLRISAIFSPKRLTMVKRPVTLRVLKEPYRSVLRQQLPIRVMQQIEDIRSLLQQGQTVYVTPEGRLTKDGLIAKFRSVISPLVGVADQIFLSSIAYDPLRSGRLGIMCRILAYTKERDMRVTLAAARPIMASQTIAKAWMVLGCSATQREVVDTGIKLLNTLSHEATLAPELMAHPRQVLARTFDYLVAQSHIMVDHDQDVDDEVIRYRVALPWRDRRFPHVADLCVYLTNQWDETESALLAMENIIL